ncbi:MAG: cytochrome P450, partial [Acidobacteriota bacterium]|nr:cytochrome P450 [Acidobacteriota bacterium]
MDLSQIDLTDSANFVEGVPHHWFAALRREAPVYWHEESEGPGFWAVTKYEECVTVNRDFEHFSSARKATFIWDIEEEQLEQQRLMMLNMDPPLHTRYRRLVNKGFTPRMVNALEEKIHETADEIIDTVIERGECDFVTEISAELPLIVIADLLGVPQEDRHNMFDWSNRMIGQQDAEYQITPEVAQQSAMELYAYAADLYAKKRANPHEDLMSVLTAVEVEGEKLSDFELELFFLLLTVAGNETTRNLMSGAMAAFFDHPDQWRTLLADRSLLPGAV